MWCNDGAEDDNNTENEDTNNQNLVTHDTNEEATEKYYFTTLEGDTRGEKKGVKTGKNWFMTGRW